VALITQPFIVFGQPCMIFSKIAGMRQLNLMTFDTALIGFNGVASRTNNSCVFYFRPVIKSNMRFVGDIFLVTDVAFGACPVSYTHLTLPTN
jgi:hypothetical protein